VSPRRGTTEVRVEAKTAGKGPAATWLLEQHLVVAQDPPSDREREGGQGALSGPRAPHEDEGATVVHERGGGEKHAAAVGRGYRHQRLNEIPLDQ
jgi:hypothetical protein